MSCRDNPLPWAAPLAVLLGCETPAPAQPLCCPLSQVNPHPVRLYASDELMYALFSDGTARCWGHDEGRICGNKPNSAPYLFQPLHRGGLACAVDLAISRSSAIAKLADGRVASWGANGFFQVIGFEPFGRALDPVPFDPGYDVDQIACSNQMTYVTSQNGDLAWWGQPHVYEQGSETLVPIPLAGLPAVRAVAADAHACAVGVDGVVWCWGSNFYGELGDGTLEERRSPAPIVGMPEPASDVVLSENVSCALTATGGVYCWGNNWGAQLGQGYAGEPGSAEGFSTIALKVDVPETLVKLFGANGGHTLCGLTLGGEAICWGSNALRSILDDDTKLLTTPTKLPQPQGIVDMALGFWNSCFLLQDHTVWCRGLGAARANELQGYKGDLIQVDFAGTLGSPPASRCLPP